MYFNNDWVSLPTAPCFTEYIYLESRDRKATPCRRNFPPYLYNWTVGSWQLYRQAGTAVYCTADRAWERRLNLLRHWGAIHSLRIYILCSDTFGRTNDGCCVLFSLYIVLNPYINHTQIGKMFHLTAEPFAVLFWDLGNEPAHHLALLHGCTVLYSISS